MIHCQSRKTNKHLLGNLDAFLFLFLFIPSPLLLSTSPHTSVFGIRRYAFDIETLHPCAYRFLGAALVSYIFSISSSSSGGRRRVGATVGGPHRGLRPFFRFPSLPEALSFFPPLSSSPSSSLYLSLIVSSSLSSLPHHPLLHPPHPSPPFSSFNILLLCQSHLGPPTRTGSCGCYFFHPDLVASLHSFHTSVSHALETGLSSRLTLFNLCHPAFAQRHLGREVITLVALSSLQTLPLLYCLVFGVLDAKD